MIVEPAPALGPLAFARLMAPFGPFESSPVLAVAVSGGRDSLALAVLAHAWAGERDGQVVALIVDHGLRAQSAAEAAATGDLLRGLGIEAHVLVWSGAKPASGVQAAARAARYRLLGEECRRCGILHLLVGHHADDQAETVTMRRARGSGADGLAGMAALVELPELRLLRPLLAVPRARLTATLQARGLRWLDDPSNLDPRFERARLRAGGAPLQWRGRAIADEEDAPLEWRAPGERAIRERALAAVAVDVLEVDPDGTVALDRAAFAALDRDLQVRLLSRIVQAVAGRDHPPRLERLKTAISRLSRASDRGKSGRARDFTLSGCALMLRQVPQTRRLRWIARPERGRNGSHALIPPAFFACGTNLAYHLE